MQNFEIHFHSREKEDETGIKLVNIHFSDLYVIEKKEV